MVSRCQVHEDEIKCECDRSGRQNDLLCVYTSIANTFAVTHLYSLSGYTVTVVSRTTTGLDSVFILILLGEISSSFGVLEMHLRKCTLVQDIKMLLLDPLSF